MNDTMVIRMVLRKITDETYFVFATHSGNAGEYVEANIKDIPEHLLNEYHDSINTFHNQLKTLLRDEAPVDWRQNGF